MRRLRESDAGYTLVELLVVMSLAVVLVSVTMAAVVNSQQVVVTTKQLLDGNQEARQALNRMARDLRQAERVTTVVNPDGAYSPTALSAVRFASDFDGDGCIGGVPPTSAPATTCRPYNAGNPEDITYCHQPDVRQLFVIDNQVAGVVPVGAGSTSCAGGRPLLAGNVVTFALAYRSNQYRYDTAPPDGITSWREVDAAQPPAGNGNGVLDLEVADVDGVVLELQVELGGRAQTYRTQVDLRNQSR